MSIGLYYNRALQSLNNDTDMIRDSHRHIAQAIAGATTPSPAWLEDEPSSLDVYIQDSFEVNVGTWGIRESEIEIQALKNKIQNYNEAFVSINAHYGNLLRIKDRLYSGGMAIIGILYILSITVF